MLVIVDSRNRSHEHTVLRSMFEARKSVFIDLLKWNLPALSGRYEVDRFDDRHAIYLVLVDDGGRHLASARLLPSSQPGILNSLFPDLCEGNLPTGPRVFEITRFCLSRDMRAVQRRAVRNQLVAAIATYALDHGIDTYTGVAEFAWLQQILAFGWDCAPLGLPKLHDGALLGAIRIEIASDTLGRLAAAGVAEGVAVELRQAA